ncbi:MAG TPA: GNAT family N-acetyltransferase [Actinophytocola sp.]|jgi:predicted GNAT family acetyltransferase|nr:GNAT family N-acetyltransferase [Actinophytocola sp.]
MRVHTTSSPDEFALRVGGWLEREPARNNVLLVHALDPNGVPPGQGDPVFSWVTDSGGEIVGAAFARLPYRMPMTEMPDDAARALAEHLVTVLPDLEGVAGAATSTKVFAARWAELTGKAAHSERDQWLMICTQTSRPAGAPGGPRMSTEDDLETVAEWFMAGMRDSGLPPEQIAQRARQLAGGQIAGGRQIVWEDADGTPAGAAGWGLNIAGVIRPAGVFVSPDHRSGGYATLLLGEVTARALENGAEATVCTHFLKYESMLAVVEKVGYKRLADFTEYRFE